MGDYLKQIFLYFRDTFNQYSGGRPNGRARIAALAANNYRGYRGWKPIKHKQIRRFRPGREGNRNLPVLKDLPTWKTWHQMLEDSMLFPGEIRAAGLYMHCATRNPNK